ncbi:putative O-glycosylation ligase, exosortase A system-associated [Psychrobium sp. 1_MG-2023]|uniref:putative O-glycosylation ligase, exosortase A system-associated n=1 Tax=Psychrobium sp. 1_MG-2023 TaxID=3062624 RepID=UPI000C31F5BA|nr:putative O-glycosylation ligase, exosortase A system-associated [Psychrobium sp. 1_MG-2023]MDP2561133.1 putative O-glycosylation ligase, exosortase A system-associated [Psychrobium sp. 1_MG-2023]PKF55109.1 putative O-glycosylation ligase, exosortase A system-associated [Alteromonadales bacterium alter-6D02]
MRDILLLTVSIALLISIFRKPFWGVLMWCWISYMVPHKLSWGFMVNFPLAQLTAIIFLFSFLISNEKKTNTLRGPLIWLILFNLWIFITYIANPMTLDAQGSFDKILKIQLFTFITYILLTTRERLNQILWVVALSILFYGFKGGIYTILSGGGGRVWGPPGGFFQGNNELGLTLLMAIPIMFYLGAIAKNRWLRWLSWLIIGLSVIAVLGTQSRGALVAILCCGFFFWVKSHSKAISLLLILMVLPIGYNFMPQSWHDRMSTIVESDEQSYDSSVQGRFNAWRMSFNLATSQPLGGGLDSFTRENFFLYAPNPDDFHDAHSIYFKVLAQQGFVGLLLFLGMWLSTWRMAAKVYLKTKDKAELEWANLLARMLQISLIAYASGGTFLGLSYFDLPYHILIFVVALYNLVEQKLEQEPESEKSATNYNNVLVS